MRPKVSVALCNYNHARYLKQCVAGILRQTYKDFELVITDDGSTDGSQKLIQDLANHDRRIVANFLPKNVGVMKAVEATMARVTGEYIYNEASDDFLVDERFFERAISALETDPRPAGFFAVTGLYSEETKQLTGSMGIAPHLGYIAPGEVMPAFLRGGLFVPGSSSIWRTARYREIGGFDFRLGPQIDYLINHLLPSLHGVIYDNAGVKVMRCFANSYSSSASLWAQAERYQLVEKILRERAPSYEGMESDWVAWRARLMADALCKFGYCLAR
ncbi:MAG: glycosyltransferase family A protein [Opitutaceae bacterium]|nr:glycosyltransferase family A protein [Opitutaceae bacterium]